VILTALTITSAAAEWRVTVDKDRKGKVTMITMATEQADGTMAISYGDRHKYITFKKDGFVIPETRTSVTAKMVGLPANFSEAKSRPIALRDTGNGTIGFPWGWHDLDKLLVTNEFSISLPKAGTFQVNLDGYPAALVEFARDVAIAEKGKTFSGSNYMHDLMEKAEGIVEARKAAATKS
jgi:hypothetical protein